MALALSAVAHARSDEALQQFHAGRSAFEAHDYDAALQAFEGALAAGLSGPAVHFNIGVAAFRLGLYSRAEAAFREVAGTPEMAALAHYNLGLVALRAGDVRTAQDWFSRAAREATDERLRALALAQLDEPSAQPRTGAPHERNWVGYAALAAGYDDNVALISNSEVLDVSGVSDSFAELQLALSAPLDRRWRFDMGLVLIDYRELDSFDLLGIQGGGRYRLHERGGWHSEVGLQIAHTRLDGESFENRHTLALQASTALRADLRLRTRYRFSDIDGRNEFSALSGQRHELGARLGWVQAAWNLGLEYQFDSSSYADDALSAKRHQLVFGVDRPLPGEWTVGLDAVLRRSRYDEAGAKENYTELALSMARILTGRWRLVVRYAYADNDADLADYDYRRKRISAGIEAVL